MLMDSAHLHKLKDEARAKLLSNVLVPRKNALLKAGNKNDRIDARKLADLLRQSVYSRFGGYWPGRVFSPGEMREFLWTICSGHWSMSILKRRVPAKPSTFLLGAIRDAWSWFRRSHQFKDSCLGQEGRQIEPGSN